MSSLPRVRGAHLVGSINQPTATDTFSIVSENLGSELARIPDGELGERFHWILFQGAVFDATPGLRRVPGEPYLLAGFNVLPLVLDGSVEAADLVIGPLGYASAAIESYADFVRLRESGTVAAGTRFQVCLPSALAPVSVFTIEAERPAIYPAYEAALLREIEAITAAIPADDLAIQFDLANEFAYIEGVGVGGPPPLAWFAADPGNPDSVIDGCVELLAHLADAVPALAQLGIHLCYGDVAEKHFVQPKDAARLTAVANGLASAIERPIDWVHLPVPIGRTDADYFAPLAALALPAETAVYLGLVHHEDGVDGALARIAPARAALAKAGLAEFGIGTECGFGRGPAERTGPLLALHQSIIEAAA